MNETSISRLMILCASLVIIVAGLRVAQPIVVPVLLSFFLATITSPAVSLLKKYALPTPLAIAFVVASLIALLGVLGSVLLTSVEQFVDRLPEYEAIVRNWLEELQVKLPWLANDLRNTIAEFRPTESAIVVLTTLFSSVGNFLFATILVTFTLIFTLVEAQTAPEKLRSALGDDNSLKYAKRFSRLVQRYLVLKSYISIFTGVLVSLYLWLTGVDYPVLWGTFAFLMNYIPNIGSMLAAIPPIALSGMQLGLSGFLTTAIGFIAINLIIGNLIEPRVMGKTLNISTLVVFLSLIFWGWVLGPIGMLLAIPLTAVIKIALEVNPNTRWLAKIMSQ